MVQITRQVSELTAAVGGRHVIFVPVPGYRDDKSGAFLEPAELDDEQWRAMVRATDDLGKIVARGVRPAAGVPPARGQPRGDPGADRAVPGPRPTRATSPSAWTPATWPTGTRTTGPSSTATPTASATCTSSRWTRPSWPRPTARASPSARPWPWAPAASCPAGNPGLVEDATKALRELGRDLFVVVEQDMYPCDFGQPSSPIAQRTYTYLRGLGIGEQE